MHAQESLIILDEYRILGDVHLYEFEEKFKKNSLFRNFSHDKNFQKYITVNLFRIEKMLKNKKLTSFFFLKKFSFILS